MSERWGVTISQEFSAEIERLAATPCPECGHMGGDHFGHCSILRAIVEDMEAAEMEESAE